MPRPCQVTFQDDGSRDQVRVEAVSVYEAACLAVKALRKAGFVEQQPMCIGKHSVSF